ncbi:MAG: winged helix-turn-helix transcriptional regulator [Spirochaetaceae bacterium]|nr:winged helix-turn-helix transcriptional regulator [Spirochaetaceae bacterium]
MADTLGFGVRNLYKFTKIYSGTEPILEEGDVFKTNVLLENGGINESEKVIFEAIRENPFARNEELVQISSLSSRTVDRTIKALREKGILKHEGPNKGGHWEIIK